VETDIGDPERAKALLDEAVQIAKILGAIVVRTKGK
jgi:hypothetical protein